MIRRPPRSTRTDTLSLHDALPIFARKSGNRFSAQRDATATNNSKPLDTHFARLTVAKTCRRAYMRRSHGRYRSHADPRAGGSPPRRARYRSEEHTSELQSLMRISYAVFCLKKKNKPQQNRNTTDTLQMNN